MSDKAKRTGKVMADFKRLRESEGWDCCEVCKWRPPAALRDVAGEMIGRVLQGHHILPIACGGADAGENLILLCPNHHAIAHHIGRMLFIEKGRKRIWTGPENRQDFHFTMAMLKNREEYPRFAKLGHRRISYLEMVHEEAIEQDVVETIRINRAFTVLRGGKKGGRSA